MPIKHIFFDLDHTLWDFETNSDKAFESAFEKLQFKIDLAKFLNYYRPINQKYWKLYREEKVTKAQLRYGRLKDTFDFLKIVVSDEMIDAMAVEYISALPESNQLFDGTLEILEHLSLKYQLHIITNGFQEVQHLKLEKSGISNYFKHVITSESVGFQKPHPDIFHYAMRVANTKPDESMMIGDNWEADIMGAHQCGMHVIFCNYHQESVGANIKSITHLLQLKQYL
ncbi:MAG: YjjG family noncanonical pyrimidine nucleotidase [Flavobacteriaceae bacterium]|nr:YjjG family noncanonical pyrimidine nucleotidase [Flavobacteriaceae bacterium]